MIRLPRTGPLDNLEVIDGPPGTGKTRTIIQEAGDWTGTGAIVTYTKVAAGVALSRLPEDHQVRAGTVYSLTWGPVKRATKTQNARKGGYRALYNERTIANPWDDALAHYEKSAPSRRCQDRYDELAEVLHAWTGDGTPPFDIYEEKPVRALRYILPLARWVEQGCPMMEEEKLDHLAIDESQDMGALEMRAALALLGEGQRARAFGDPGQAIYAQSKGYSDGLPPVWKFAGRHWLMPKGYRVGNPVAAVASRVLAPHYVRPENAFAKEGHRTDLLEWDPHDLPKKGLVLGYSRKSISDFFKEHDLRNTAVVPLTGKPDEKLVLSTIHAAKGAEADDVYLLPWGREAIKRLEDLNPNELRVLYVALTRARKRVHIPWQLHSQIQAI
jgi:hypothetical protein